MWFALYISLCCVIGLLNQVEAACPDGFEPHGDSCYKVLNLEASWAEAQMYCQILGSQLAIIDSAVEESAVEGMLSRLYHAHVDNTYWIAGTDISTEATWMWMSKGGVSSPIAGYSNWPVGGVPSDSRNHNCLVIIYHGTKTTWDDAHCSNLHSFVCETQNLASVNTTETAVLRSSSTIQPIVTETSVEQ